MRILINSLEVLSAMWDYKFDDTQDYWGMNFIGRRRRRQRNGVIYQHKDITNIEARNVFHPSVIFDD
jgi:hypothetical protein